MPIIFQQQLSAGAKLALWEITESLSFFEQYIDPVRHIPHEEVKKQHLAARATLLALFPQFPLAQLVLSPSGKPYLEGGPQHVSFSHTTDFAAAIISPKSRVGVDVEGVGERIFRIRHKFLSDQEQDCLQTTIKLETLQETEVAAQWLTLCWSAKESLYKWQGESGVDFIRDLKLKSVLPEASQLLFETAFQEEPLRVGYKCWDSHVLTWVHA
ncbi:MAG: 4'-phosphopantetheinyl transferase family protein [Bacteroidota bacterium]